MSLYVNVRQKYVFYIESFGVLSLAKYYYYLVFSYQTISDSDERLVTIVESMTDKEAKIQNDLIIIQGM